MIGIVIAENADVRDRLDTALQEPHDATKGTRIRPAAIIVPVSAKTATRVEGMTGTGTVTGEIGDGGIMMIGGATATGIGIGTVTATATFLTTGRDAETEMVGTDDGA